MPLPLGPPLPPSNVRLSSATPTSVTVAWEAPAGSTDLTFYKVVIGNSPSDPTNTTELLAQLVYERTITPLVEGTVYYVTVQSQDLSGWSPPAQVPARPIAQATAPTNVTILAMSAGHALLEWDPPLSLTTGPVTNGLSISGYQVEARFPLGDPAGAWQVLGTTSNQWFMHRDVGTFGVTLYYAVRAVILQDPSLGPLELPGAQAPVQVYFGRAPAWRDGSVADAATVHVPLGGRADVPLLFNASDPMSVSLTVRSLEALPPTAYWGPALQSSDANGVYLSQNLSVGYNTDLAGSSYTVCVTARDLNGLEAPVRCITVSIPRPHPRLVSPPTGARFTARIGCVLTIDVVSEDRTSADIPAPLALSLGHRAGVTVRSVGVRSRYRADEGLALPEGASLVPTAPPGGANPAVVQLTWRPIKGQEAFDYDMCFVAEGALEGDPSVCVVVTVSRCLFCANVGDSLQTVAQLFHTTWSEVWSGNHLLADPDLVQVEQIITLGPTYLVRSGDDLDHVADRFGVSLPDMLLWNPDVGDASAAATGYRLFEMQELCVIPKTCVYDASIGDDPRKDGLVDPPYLEAVPPNATAAREEL